MAYSESQKRNAANALQRAMPGFKFNVAYAWVNAEQGWDNNPLGITAYGSSCGSDDLDIGGGRCLLHFSSLDAGANAVRNLLYGASRYNHVQNAIQNGDEVSQAVAIIWSAWHLGSVSEKHGSPYYWRMFRKYVDIPWKYRPDKKKNGPPKPDPDDPDKPKPDPDNPGIPNWIWEFIVGIIAKFLAQKAKPT